MGLMQLFFKRFSKRLRRPNSERTELRSDLNEKLKQYYKDCRSGVRPSEYFTWDEFYEVFTTICHQFEFFYEDYIVVIVPCYFVIEDLITEEYGTPHELLDNAKVDGRSLKEIWDELTKM